MSQLDSSDLNSLRTRGLCATWCHSVKCQDTYSGPVRSEVRILSPRPITHANIRLRPTCAGLDWGYRVWGKNEAQQSGLKRICVSPSVLGFLEPLLTLANVFGVTFHLTSYSEATEPFQLVPAEGLFLRIPFPLENPFAIRMYLHFHKHRNIQSRN